MTPELRASYRFCDQLARRAARNFYYGFLLLPPRKRAAMCALYAFMRHSDDLADQPAPAAERRRALESWRQAVNSALDRRAGGAWPGLAAFADTVARFDIPRPFLEAVLDGVGMDIDPHIYPTFADLHGYCYRVASAVGLCCLRIWGYDSRGGRAEALAEACGVALQLTNIVRDVREDALAGRVYLPVEDLERFGVAPSDLAADHLTERVRALLEFECKRAREYYECGAPLLGLVQPSARPVFGAIFGISRALLTEIERRGYDVCSGRVALPAWRKSALALRAMAYRFAPDESAGSPNEVAGPAARAVPAETVGPPSGPSSET